MFHKACRGKGIRGRVCSDAGRSLAGGLAVDPRGPTPSAGNSGCGHV